MKYQFIYDHAPMESFFAPLKAELTYRSRAETRATIFEHIEVFYNRRRLHSSLGYLSQAEFERRNGSLETVSVFRGQLHKLHRLP